MKIKSSSPGRFEVDPSTMIDVPLKPRRPQPLMSLSMPATTASMFRASRRSSPKGGVVMAWGYREFRVSRLPLCGRALLRHGPGIWLAQKDHPGLRLSALR